jgi:exodeoxyribonuclease-3
VQSRYLEAAVGGILIAGFYLPNGNPRPGPKFDYKLAWMGRLIAHAATLFGTDAPVVLAGDYNVMPTEMDVYKPERWIKDALFAPEVRAAFFRSIKVGWMHCGQSTRTKRSTRSGTISGTRMAATPGSGSIIFF